MVEWINFVKIEISFKNIEKKLGVKLPPDLKEIVKLYNKGMPRPNKIRLENGKFVEVVQMLSFNFDEQFTVYSCMTDFMKAEKIVPIAVTKNNNFVCIKDDGIILYNVELNVEKKLCTTFTEFLGKLE